MLIAVAAAGWLAFNARFLSILEHHLPAQQAGRVWIGRALALAVSPSLGGAIAWLLWRAIAGKPDWWGRARAALAGACAGLAAGGVAWYAATIFLCFGHAADGQTLLAAFMMGAQGALLHAFLGAFLGLICWRPPRAPGEVRTIGPLPEFLRSDGHPDE